MDKKSNNRGSIVVGLESHIVLDQKTKLFCNCKPYEQECEICRGLPGTLPNFTFTAVQKAILATKALKSQTVKDLVFYRKHYFYHDLPTGFQRSQHPLYPFSKNGELYCCLSQFKVKLKHILLEEDPAATEKYGVNFKRGGNALLEVVTEPCFKGPVDQVTPLILEYLRTLKKLMIDLGVTTLESTLKSDVNISLGQDKCRYEIKNVSSYEEIRKCLKEGYQLLLTDKDFFNKTFKYQNKLVYSRPKTDYLYYREVNLPEFNLNQLTEKLLLPSNTLYDLICKALSPYDQVTYAKSCQIYRYCKKLQLAHLKKQINTQQLEDLISKEPVMGEKELKALIKPQNTPLLNFLRALDLKINRSDFKSKNSNYCLFYNNLKRDLIAAKIKFSSYQIQEMLEDLIKA